MNALKYALAVGAVASGLSAFAAQGQVVHARAASPAQGSSAASPAQGASAAAPAQSSPAAASPEPNASAVATPAAVVDTKDFAYAPNPLHVHAGDTVLFKNSDSVAHTVSAADGSFDSGNMSQGQSWSHVFAKAGTYAYYCAYHRYMKATVEVK